MMMRLHVFMTGILLFLMAFTSDPNQGQNQLIVTVESINEEKGSIRVGLFRTKDEFLKKATYGKVVPVRGKAVKVIFDDLDPGSYGISIIHDLNDNGELDTNALGIPKEGFGFGNNAMGMFGPPSFDKASVTIDHGLVHQVLRMRYF
jgi:uncharacterized protein (DUF2141 family)